MSLFKATSLIYSIMLLISYIPSIRGKSMVYNLLRNYYLRIGGSPFIKIKFLRGETINLDLRSDFEWSMARDRKHNNIDLEKIFQSIDVNKDIIDVGANIGAYTIQIANFIKSKNGLGKVYAFEPVKNNFNRLNLNILENELGSFVNSYNIGLSDKSCSKDIVLREDFKQGADTGNASISISNKIDANFETQSINLVALDGFIKENALDLNVGYIKVITEGHEDFFFKGASRLILKNKPIISFNINPKLLNERGDIKDLDMIFPVLLPGYSFTYRNARISSLDEKPVISFNDLSDISLITSYPH